MEDNGLWPHWVQLKEMRNTYRVGQRKRGHRLLTIILSNLNRFTKFFTERFLGIFAVKKIPPHLAYVATLPCETLMLAKQAINDKLQGSIAAFLRCGGVVNNQIKKSLLLSLWVKKNKICEYSAKLQAKTWFYRTLSSSFSSVLARRAKCMKQPRSCL